MCLCRRVRRGRRDRGEHVGRPLRRRAAAVLPHAGGDGRHGGRLLRRQGRRQERGPRRGAGERNIMRGRFMLKNGKISSMVISIFRVIESNFIDTAYFAPSGRGYNGFSLIAAALAWSRFP